MSAPSSRRVVDFEGHPVATVLFEGRPAWVAAQVGEALGYPNCGSRFADKITGEWAEEFIAGTDFETITNGRLASLRAQLATDGDEELDSTKTVEPKSPQRGARSLTILYESGLHLALLKTRKPAGRRLRRLLATEVLPQLVRTGRYEPEAPASLPAPTEPSVTVKAPQALEVARWAASVMQTTPDAVLSEVLDAWVRAMEHHRKHSLAFARLPFLGHWLLVPVEDGTFEVLARGVRQLGHTVTPVSVSYNARHVLAGHALIASALTPTAHDIPTLAATAASSSLVPRARAR